MHLWCTCFIFLPLEMRLVLLTSTGNKQNAASCDLSDILPEGVEDDVKEAAEISMGTDIAEEDIQMILCLCQQVQIFSYSILQVCLYIGVL